MLETSDIVLIIVILINILLSAYVFHKIRRIHMRTLILSRELRKISEKHLVDHFQQGQYLEILQHELGLADPLPITRGWAASPDFLLLITRHAREHKPKVVVECSSGTSTVVLAQCMRLNGAGHVFSMDHDPEFAEITRANLVKFGLSDWATVVDAPLRLHDLRDGQTWQWYSSENLPASEIDMLVIDGPPMPIGPMVRYPAGPLLFPKLRPGGTAFLDDAARPDESRIVDMWMKQFPEMERSNHYCEKGCTSLRAK